MNVHNVVPFKAPTSVEFEKVALSILTQEVRYWISNGMDFCDFDEDFVIELLVEKGVLPSRLACDLDWLVARAWRSANGGGASLI